MTGGIDYSQIQRENTREAPLFYDHRYLFIDQEAFPNWKSWFLDVMTEYTRWRPLSLKNEDDMCREFQCEAQAKVIEIIIAPTKNKLSLSGKKQPCLELDFGPWYKLCLALDSAWDRAVQLSQYDKMNSLEFLRDTVAGATKETDYKNNIKDVKRNLRKKRRER